MILVLILILLISVLVSIRYPTHFVCLYILLTTKCLGFFDINSITLSGIGIFHPILNLICLFNFAINFNKKNKIDNYIKIVFFLIILGILKPVAVGHSTLIKAIFSSKEYWYYFLYLYLISNKIEGRKILKLLNFLAYYFSSIYIISKFTTNILPPEYFKDNVVRTFFPTYISLIYFISLFDLKTKTNIKNISKSIFLLIGIFLAGHSSLFITGVLATLIIIFFISKSGSIRNGLEINIMLIISLIIIVVSSFIFLEHFHKSTTYQDFENSLVSRDNYNEFRWNLIKKDPYIGYGFIHKSSAFGKQQIVNSSNRFMERLDVIDSGYVDLLIRFGFIGLLILFYFYYKICISYIRSGNLFIILLGFFLFQYLLIAYTWSVFSYAHGIIPLVLSLYLIKKNENTLYLAIL